MNDDVGLGRLQSLGRVVLNLEAKAPTQADDLAQIASNLGGIGVDPADDLEARPRSDLLRDGAANRTQAEVHHADIGHTREL